MEALTTSTSRAITQAEISWAFPRLLAAETKPVACRRLKRSVPRVQADCKDQESWLLAPSSA